jgi:hypothetical protein
MRTLFIIAALSVAALSSGCATITTGWYQQVSVESSAQGAPLAGAACRLENNKGSWFVRTPGTVPVHRSYQDMKVSCTHDDHEAALVTIPSSTRAIVFGNILIGGAVGAGVDIGTGSAYDYPTLITVEFGLRPPLAAQPPPAVAKKE